MRTKFVLLTVVSLVNQCFPQVSRAVFDNLAPLLQLVMDNNEQVAALALQVLTLVMAEIEEQFFLQLMQKLLDMFRSDALSPAKGEHLIRSLAALLSAEKVFTTFAVLLADEAVCQQAMSGL